MVETDFAVSYDIPTDAEMYARRAKLVAENGTHFSLVTPRERQLLNEIETFLGQRVKAVLPPTRAATVTQRTETFKTAFARCHRPQQSRNLHAAAE